MTMKTRTLCAAVAAVALCVATAPLSSFAEAKSATLSATGYSGTETLTGFPALVKLSASNDAYGFSYSDCVNGKDDLWFEDADGNVIPHEVDTWNASGDSYVWVRIPNLDSSSEIVMHWGATPTAEQMTTENVWTGYVGVWHMNETGTNAEPDKTANGLEAAPIDNSNVSTSLNTAEGAVGAGRGRPGVRTPVLWGFAFGVGPALPHPRGGGAGAGSEASWGLCFAMRRGSRNVVFSGGSPTPGR